MIKKSVVSSVANPDGAIKPLATRIRLYCQDKSELERKIEEEKARGWLLVSRNYSLDDGHGAELRLPVAD